PAGAPFFLPPGRPKAKIAPLGGQQAGISLRSVGAFYGDHVVKWFILALFIACTLVVHFRGRVRHRFSRQVLDRSTFTAPLNCFMYASSAVRNTPYLDLENFPELKVLLERCDEIRAEAERLYGDGHIKASDKYNDA